MKFTINEQLISKFEEKLDQFINKFGDKINYTYVKSEPYHVEEGDRQGQVVVDVDLDAKYKLGDYEFVCSLEWNNEAQENLILKASDDVYVPSLYKTRRECDHCKTDRGRKYTIVLKQGSKYIQVGKSCVKEYIGIDLGNYAAYLSLFENLEDYLKTCEKENSRQLRVDFTTEEILNQTVEEVRRNGYISKQQSYELDTDSTSSRVWSALTRYIPWGEHEPLYTMYPVTNDTKQDVADLVAFYNNLPEEDITDYVGNIITLLKSKWVDPKNLGIVVSAVGTKLRIEGQRKEREQSKASEYVGEIGERITFKSKPTCIYSAENEFGPFRIYKMSADGNEFVWKTSKWLNPDMEYEFTATVKSHEEFRGVKQTEITRARTK